MKEVRLLGAVLDIVIVDKRLKLGELLSAETRAVARMKVSCVCRSESECECRFGLQLPELGLSITASLVRLEWGSVQDADWPGREDPQRHPFP